MNNNALQQFFNQINENTERLIKKKLREQIKFTGKSHCVILENVHKFSYAKLFMSKAKFCERPDVSSDLVIQNIRRIQPMLGICPIKATVNGDINIITPFAHTTQDIVTDDITFNDDVTIEKVIFN